MLLIRRLAAYRTGVIVFTVVACSFGLVKVVGAFSTFAIDLEVYRAAGRAVLQGNALYEQPLALDKQPKWALPFTYTPWAAILFTPLALLSAPVARFVIAIANDALLVFVAFRSWQVMRPATNRRRLLLLAVLTATLLFLTEAVHYTVYNGQVNLLLLALVLGDLIRNDDRRTKGMGLGIAAGIKLTPLIFLPYLLATRKLRAAVVATATFLCTVALGFLILPHDSTQFWLTGTLTNVGRIYPNTTSTHNQSLRGMLLRSGMPTQSAQIVWLVVSVAIGLLTILVAVWATHRGLHLLALTLCGLGSAAFSPWAWGHHWVWLIPLAVFLAHQASEHNRHTAHPLWLLPALLLPLTLPRILFLADPLDGSATGPVLTTGAPAFVVGNLYVLIFVSTLVASIAHLRRLDRMNSTPRLDAHALNLPVASRRQC